MKASELRELSVGELREREIALSQELFSGRQISSRTSEK